jgi:hypothetical protein
MAAKHRKAAVERFGADYFSEDNGYGAPIPVHNRIRDEKYPIFWEFVQYLLETPGVEFTTFVSRFLSKISSHVTTSLLCCAGKSSYNCSIQGEQKVRERFSHCPSAHCVCRIALKPTPLDFSGHVLSSNVIEYVKNIPQIVFLPYTRKIVSNEARILKFQ